MRNGDKKATFVCVLVVLIMLMYTALVIPLSFDPAAERGIRSGKGDKSKSKTSAPLTDHPYFGMFVFDLIIV